MILKLSTARNVGIWMGDSTDRMVGKTGLTLTITASKNGAAFGSISPTVTELANGWYSLALTTSHTDTLGDLLIHATGSGADAADRYFQVCAELPGVLASSTIQSIWDGMTSALTTSGSIGKLLVDNINATISSRSTLTAALVWDYLTSAISTVGSIGKLIKDNLDVVLSTRATETNVTSQGAAVSAIGTNIYNRLGAPNNPTIVDDIQTYTDLIYDLLADEIQPAIASLVGIKKNTALPNFQFAMFDSSGDPKTGATVTVSISKDGGTFAAVDGTVTEISNGFYKVSFTSTEMNAKNIAVKASATGAKSTLFLITTEG